VSNNVIGKGSDLLTPLEIFIVIIFMGPLCLVGVSFILYTIYSIFVKIGERFRPLPPISRTVGETLLYLDNPGNPHKNKESKE